MIKIMSRYQTFILLATIICRSFIPASVAAIKSSTPYPNPVIIIFLKAGSNGIINDTF
jgi:hypothetical protein